MYQSIDDLITESARRTPDGVAVQFRDQSIDYQGLYQMVEQVANGFVHLGIQRYERIAIYLPKTPHCVGAFFAAAMAGAVFVPLNPLLKPPQVAYIMRDCNARILITTPERLRSLQAILAQCPDIHTVICVPDAPPEDAEPTPHYRVIDWAELVSASVGVATRKNIDTDMAAILYTSGSTGKPKGVVLSHRNLLCGAQSVARYLGNDANDRLLAVLPFSFDYGFSQLSTAFSQGARVVLMDYLLPRDVIKAVAKFSITGLAAVPPLWIQLAQLPWPSAATQALRYITNSGGAMPKATLQALREHLPNTQVFLMYGLTEAFRSTYLPPEQLAQRPDSMGKAIPNAELMVVREDGSPCAPGEPGELLHRGSLVAMGYWNDTKKTAQRFKPLPNPVQGLPMTELCVWSGDKVRIDEEGYFYFIARQDEMIKTSGYRVSPTEIEELAYQSKLVGEAVAMGVAHENLGQAILLITTPMSVDKTALLNLYTQQLPAYMVPADILVLDHLDRNPNGKIDRKKLHETYNTHFLE